MVHIHKLYSHSSGESQIIVSNEIKNATNIMKCVMAVLVLKSIIYKFFLLQITFSDSVNQIIQTQTI